MLNLSAKGHNKHDKLDAWGQQAMSTHVPDETADWSESTI